MNLIIEAGGTKTNLLFIETGEVIASYEEIGLHVSREPIDELKKRLMIWNELGHGNLQSIYLFAAGKMDQKKEKEFTSFAKSTFSSTVNIYSDLLGACFATAGHQPGIVGILGTGSNSCYYNGKEIVKQVPPGGFILGDEGSGTQIGKKVLIDYLRNELPAEFKVLLEGKFNIFRDDITAQLYGGSMKDAAAFCSLFTPLVIDNIHIPYCKQVCTNSIDQFLQLVEKNYMTYSNRLYLVGSIAHLLTPLIMERARTKNIQLVKVIQHPIKDLSLFLAALNGL
jgi:N-acetylglucosamine kinase-like BadF-type ATPase